MLGCVHLFVLIRALRQGFTQIPCHASLCILVYFFLHVTLACSIFGLTLAFHRCVMTAESPKSLTVVDESFTTEDHLQQGRSLPLLGAQNKAFKKDELSLDSVPPIDPKCISQ
ncbi:hypothetical protein C1H46_001658 [Malus baccata]|uniref:Uncharacterized protein n=1 Tax=Malus baccata TaxID=106549 RepID=A0A540NP37_MALBA|nr:hypothetical protein C1H46_001658 [Malus baccata]